MQSRARTHSTLRIGWSAADITPPHPVFIAGQFHARVSEGVQNPISATVLALSSDAEHAVFVSCDLVGIPDGMRDAIRRNVSALVPDLEPARIILNATHTHTAPDVRPPDPSAGHTSVAGPGVDLDVAPIQNYVDWAVSRITDAIAAAWTGRTPGAVAFGLGQAVVAHNRRWVDLAGFSTMYGNTDTPEFSHVEGYVDHDVNVLATYDATGELTGLVVNVPCPSQVTEHLFEISADYWHETRRELRRRLGRNLYILAQCSAAGDSSPHPIVAPSAYNRMLSIRGRTEREELAVRVATAVEDVLGCIRDTRETHPVLSHRFETLQLPLTLLDETAVATARAEADALKAEYETALEKLKQDPELRKQPRWYVPASMAFRKMNWNLGVIKRYEMQAARKTWSADVHVVRIGEMVFATNPFEFYLDFGMFIKARSTAAQTFLVQLAGAGTYVPSARSVSGGGYGSVPASNPVGPEGGRILAERTIELIRETTPDCRYGSHG